MTAVFALLLFAISYVGWASARPMIQLGIPLLFAAELFLRDDRARMLAFGVIVAIALAVAATAAETLRDAMFITAAGVFLVRWLPFEDVIVWREIVVLIGVLLIAALLILSGAKDLRVREAPARSLEIAAAVAVAIVTPVIPMRGLLFPFIVAALTLMMPNAIARAAVSAVLLASVAFTRYSYAPLLIVAAIVIALPLIRRIPVIPHTAAIALFALWPWSGLLARSFPAFLRATPASERTETVSVALGASETAQLDVPEQSRRLVVTACGVRTERLRSGQLLGKIEVQPRSGPAIVRDIRIGDVADFGFMRREQFLRARNRPPVVPTPDVRGSGATAWLHGAGRIAIEPGIEIVGVRITAAPDLPRGAKLLIESAAFE